MELPFHDPEKTRVELPRESIEPPFDPRRTRGRGER
jgi:hypothetical protein